MNKIAMENLLTAKQMAQFVTEGFLVMEDIVPRELNERAHAEQNELWEKKGNQGQYWNNSSIIREIFELPQVEGVIQSLVGRNPGYDHSFLHIVGPRHLKGQTYHADSIIDTRPYAFDIQAFYFSHDAPKEMGPTLILPGSHLRKVNTASIGGYKNIIGQKQCVAKAGTIVFMHHGIWHCAQPNFTDNTRFVFKLRLRPAQQQRGLFNTEGYDSPEVRNIIYRGYQMWQGNEGRLDHMNRAGLWRYVTGDEKLDVSFEGAFTRMGIRE